MLDEDEKAVLDEDAVPAVVGGVELDKSNHFQGEGSSIQKTFAYSMRRRKNLIKISKIT